MFEALEAQLQEVEPEALATGDLAQLVLAAERLRGVLDALALRALEAFDRRQGDEADGAVSAATWLAARAGVSSGAARRRLRVARALRHLPAVTDGLVRGSLSFEQASVICRQRVPATEAAMARDEQVLVGVAATLPVDELTVALRLWRERADADGVPPAPEAQRLHASRTLDGRVVLSGTLDAADGELVLTHLDDLATQLRRAERDPSAPPQTGAERRAAALVEMARRSAAAAPESVPARPAVTLVIRADDLVAGAGGVSERGTHLPSPAVRRLLCDTDIGRLILDAEGLPLDLGRMRRTASPHQRRALIARDGGCGFPGCDRPPNWCSSHHIVHWTDEGPTDLDNLVLLCHRHHHLVHEGGWTLQRIGQHHAWRRAARTARCSPSNRCGRQGEVRDAPVSRQQPRPSHHHSSTRRRR